MCRLNLCSPYDDWLHNCRLNRGVNKVAGELGPHMCKMAQAQGTPLCPDVRSRTDQVVGPSTSTKDIFVSRKNNREWATIMSSGSIIRAIHDLNVYLVNPLSHKSNCFPEMGIIPASDWGVATSREGGTQEAEEFCDGKSLKVVDAFWMAQWCGEVPHALQDSSAVAKSMKEELNLILGFLLFNLARVNRRSCLERPVSCIWHGVLSKLCFYSYL